VTFHCSLPAGFDQILEVATVLEIQHRPLGRSDLMLPRVSLGCGNFGGVGSAPAFFGQGTSPDGARELMDAAWELGINHFDTADAYGGGRSETMIGDWIRSRGVRPMITTKTFNPMDDGADHGLARDRIARQLDHSLERLGVDCVDLYLAHDFDPDVPLADTFAMFEELQRAGKIRAYGVSNFTAAQLRDAVAAGQPAAIQNSYSLLERGDGEAGGVLEVCAEHRLAYIVFSPLAGGWLTGKYRRGQQFPTGSRMTQRPEPYGGFLHDRTFDALEDLDALSAQRGTSMAGTALAWLLADDRVGQVVTGPGRPEHLTPVREALEHPLTDAERARLEEVFN
jgi:aryl-alcohol dehydrogenase-like predicted oxidoreductase